MTVTTEVLAPTFVLYENDQKVTDKALLASVVRITVDERLDQAGVALVELSDRGLALSQGSHFGVGTSLKLELGYVGATDVLFDGEVTAWRESFPRRGVPVLVVVALDRFHRLRRERKTKTFCSMKDSDIVRQVLGDHSLQVEADATDVTHDYVIQANQSDADFLLARAGLNGFELKIDGKKAAFRKPKLDDSAAVTLKWHEDLTSFTSVVSLANAHAAVQASGYDMKQKQAVSVKAEAGSESSSMGGQKTGNQVLKDSLSASEPTADPFRPLLTQEEATLLANATLNRDAKKFVTGEGTVVGNTQVRRGAVIEIDGIGDYLSGNYYVQTAIHTLLPRLGYTTVFRVQKTSVQQKKAPPQKQGEQGQPPAPPPEATGAVEFVVRNQFDEPVEGLEYVLYCPDGEKKTGTIPANGVVREENAKGGLYKLALKGLDPPIITSDDSDDDEEESTEEDEEPTTGPAPDEEPEGDPAPAPAEDAPASEDAPSDDGAPPASEAPSGADAPASDAPAATDEAESDEPAADAAPSNEVWVSLAIDPNEAKSADDKFVLTSDDGSVSIEKTIKDDAVAGDDKVELQFSGLDPAKTYSLQIVEPAEDPYYVFQGVAYSDLAAGGGAAGGDDGSADGTAGDAGDEAQGGDEPYEGDPEPVCSAWKPGAAKANELWVTLAIDPNEAKSSSDKFVLSSADGSIRQEKTVKDDQIPGDDKVELEFEGLDPAQSYTLEVIESDGTSSKVFENVPYDQLSKGPAGGDDDGGEGAADDTGGDDAGGGDGSIEPVASPWVPKK